MMRVAAVLFPFLLLGSQDQDKDRDKKPQPESIVLTGHSSGVSKIAFTSDGEMLVAASYDKHISLWGMFTGGRIECASFRTRNRSNRRARLKDRKYGRLRADTAMLSWRTRRPGQLLTTGESGSRPPSSSSGT
jgi:WD40 repeat protein